MKQEDEEIAHLGNRNKTRQTLISRLFWISPWTGYKFLVVIANVVSTLDGVVSYEVKGHAGGSSISGSDPADRFIMGLLRASADAVMVGARTVQDASTQSLWIPEYTYPDAKDLYAEYRVNVLHKPEYPILVVVSGSGKLELERAIFRTPGVLTVVITTSAGRDALARAGATKLPSIQIMLWIRGVERSPRWRCCDCCTRSLG